MNVDKSCSCYNIRVSLLLSSRKHGIAKLVENIMKIITSRNNYFNIIYQILIHVRW